jgi:hypothetical protein
VDIHLVQLMLGHASLQQTQRYLNVTDEELRRGLEVSWKRARPASAPTELRRGSSTTLSPSQRWVPLEADQ